MNTLTAAKASIEAAAANKAREQAAAEAKRKAEEQARQQAAIRAANTYAMPANGSVVATAAGRGLIQVAQGAASLAQAISDAIAVLGRVLASAPSVMAVGFASLTYSSRTAEQWQDQTPDSVRYALGMDAAKLGLPPSVNLNAVAKASGTVDLPMRLTNEARGNTTTLSVVSTDGVSVPKAVPIRMAAYNATTGLYEVTVPSTTAEAPPLILTWTPASPPGNQNPSSTTPVVPKPVPVYEGATLTPVKAKPETYPGVTTLPDDLIIGFPADSGIKPIYVMISREHSYHPAPATLPAFPDALRAKPKTSIQGGGGLRKRWKDKKGNIYEWDSQHGSVEMYDKRGRHLGEFNSNTGARTKPADPKRSVEP
ncbi:TPA: S-type pyocin domain-containing protein [Pseudomonas aeruginosa]|nr:S-type pyocin domain-containing protein [Pseudomonas aeruginosa]HCE6667975.1 S-type pyocin domain-containing protein [Pseudomonas aeruginosa]HEN8476140.1 S-type pyocin domain-containing protein [Pseudomonas aeruginosa]HEN8485164.1 S-type pyocin domain-containing protein [Pseudomonas aeruginosa]HEN8493934.1 S-type pyocin domain-containing protein [Pseudomonas aeruginosa]